MNSPSINLDPIKRLDKFHLDSVRAQEDKKIVLEREKKALASLETKVKALDATIDDMKTASDFLVRKTSWSTTEDPGPYVTGVADDGTLVGDYKFEVVALATETERGGASDVGQRLSETSDVTGVTLNTMPVHTAITKGFFTVNGVRIEIYDPADTPTETYAVKTTDTLDDLFTAIENSSGGALNVTYSEVTDTMEIDDPGLGEVFVGTSGDTSNFLSVMKLIGNGTSTVTSQSALGSVQLGSSIANSNLTTTATTGEFKLNGFSFTYDVDADSLDSLMQKINASSADVFVSYDPVSDKFALQNQETGSLDLTVEDVSGNLLEAMGLNSTSTLTKGVNAQFKLNDGSTITTTSNILKDDVHGVKGLSVTAKKIGTDTIKVEQDETASRKLLDDFIEKFNDIQSFIKIKTNVVVGSDGKLVKADLANNREVVALSRDLRAKVFAAVTSLSGGAIKRIADLHIDFVKDSNELEVTDSTKLNEALKNESITVSALFSDSTDGYATVMDTFLENTLKDKNTTFDKKAESLDKQIKDFTDKIKKLEDDHEKTKLEIQQAQTRMELAMQDMNMQLSFLRARFG